LFDGFLHFFDFAFQCAEFREALEFLGKGIGVVIRFGFFRRVFSDRVSVPARRLLHLLVGVAFGSEFLPSIDVVLRYFLRHLLISFEGGSSFFCAFFWVFFKLFFHLFQVFFQENTSRLLSYHAFSRQLARVLS
jgi:hypothetical protein